VNRRTLFIFFLLNLLLSSVYLDKWENANTVSRLLPSKMVVESGTFQIDRLHEKTIDKAFINQHYYSDKAPLPALLVIPFYAGMYYAGVANNPNNLEPLLLLGSFLLGSIPFALIVTLFFLKSYRIFNSISNAAISSMLLCYSLYVFAYSGTAFSHVLTSMFLLLSLILLVEKSKLFLSGLFAGCAFLCEFPSGIALVIFPVVYFIINKKIKPSLLFVAGFTPALIIIGVYNLYFTGNSFDMLYNHPALEIFQTEKNRYGFAQINFIAMYKLLFSTYRGLFFYTPVLIALVFIWIRKPNKDFTSLWLALTFAVVSVMMFSSHLAWWGGWCWGPRHLIPAVVLLSYALFSVFEFKSKDGAVFLISSLAGITITFLAKITAVYSFPSEILNPLSEIIFPNLIKNQLNENNLFTMLFGISPLLSAIIWLLMFVAVIYFFKQKKNEIAI
jgi:hypothetical protein